MSSVNGGEKWFLEPHVMAVLLDLFLLEVCSNGWRVGPIRFSSRNGPCEGCGLLKDQQQSSTSKVKNGGLFSMRNTVEGQRPAS